MCLLRIWPDPAYRWWGFLASSQKTPRSEGTSRFSLRKFFQGCISSQSRSADVLGALSPGFSSKSVFKVSRSPYSCHSSVFSGGEWSFAIDRCFSSALQPSSLAFGFPHRCLFLGSGIGFFCHIWQISLHRGHLLGCELSLEGLGNFTGGLALDGLALASCRTGTPLKCSFLEEAAGLSLCLLSRYPCLAHGTVLKSTWFPKSHYGGLNSSRSDFQEVSSFWRKTLLYWFSKPHSDGL